MGGCVRGPRFGVIRQSFNNTQLAFFKPVLFSDLRKQLISAGSIQLTVFRSLAIYQAHISLTVLAPSLSRCIIYQPETPGECGPDS